MALFIIFLLAVAAVYYSSRSERLERLEREVARLSEEVEKLTPGKRKRRGPRPSRNLSPLRMKLRPNPLP